MNYYSTATGPETIEIPVTKNSIVFAVSVAYYVAPVINGVAAPPVSTTTFTPAVIATDGSTGWVLQPDTPKGEYQVWAKLVDYNNTVVVPCGGFRVI